MVSIGSDRQSNKKDMKKGDGSAEINLQSRPRCDGNCKNGASRSLCTYMGKMMRSNILKSNNNKFKKAQENTKQKTHKLLQ